MLSMEFPSYIMIIMIVYQLKKASQIDRLFLLVIDLMVNK